jgi:glutamate synthase domain-containing protein 3
VGKGLSGGRLILYPSRAPSLVSEENVLLGNSGLYGATSGEAFLNGVAGGRFAVRNSGATAVVGGVGDNCCEYMTNGLVVVLGRCGRNFAAGMIGGRAIVLDDIGDFADKCNLSGVDLEAAQDHDAEMLRAVVGKHVAATGSPKGKRILDRWEQFLPKFVTIRPRDRQRA